MSTSTHTVKQIFEIRKGRKVDSVLRKKSQDSVRYLQIGDLRGDANIQYTEDVHLVGAHEDDMIIAWDGSNAGTVGFGLGGVIGSTLARLRIRDKFSDQYEPAFLGYFLQSKFRYLQDTATGAAIPHVSKSALEKIEIPEEDLTTQRQIVTALDKTKGLIDLRQQSFEMLDDFLRATFLELFGDPITNPHSWPIKALKDLGEWKSGGTPSRSNDSYFEGDVPWYTSGELDSVYLTSSKEKISQSAIQETSAKLIEPNSLLVGMYDTAALKLGITTEKSSCNQAIAFSQLEEDKVHTLYVYYALKFSRDHLLSRRRGARQKNLNQSMVKAIRIPIPTPQSQQQFVSQIQLIFRLKQKLQKHSDDIETLFQSLLQRAFYGDLTIDPDLQLDGYLENENFAAIATDAVLIQTLIDRFNQAKTDALSEVVEEDGEEETNPFRFETKAAYDRAKDALFHLLKAGLVTQKTPENEEEPFRTYLATS